MSEKQRPNVRVALQVLCLKALHSVGTVSSETSFFSNSGLKWFTSKDTSKSPKVSKAGVSIGHDTKL